MSLLSLYAGLLLPWIAGTTWLIFFDTWFYGDMTPNRYRQAGYGFFLGYAALSLAIIVCNKSLGVVSWPVIMAFLLFCTVAGSAATYLSSRTTHPNKHGPRLSSRRVLNVLLVITLLLTATHLLSIAMEVFTRPVYPWDAWLAWVYRAKAWYLAGAMTDIVSPDTWATINSTGVYTIDAWHYPLFASVIPYWAALSMGTWSETLVNVPVLLAGLALGMAMYGQWREHGLSAATGLVSCYLLYSIPLLGTHLALAGYADIWMAGFAGLGFVSLMRGTITRGTASASGFQILLGLLMIFFSAWVKNEGAVWFLAALAMLIVATCKPRVPILIMVFAIIVTLFGFVLGQTYINIPLIGELGFMDGHLAIPFIGRFNLEVHNVWRVYFDNFITMGSWNLLWVAVIASLLLGFKSPNLSSGYRARRTSLSFILVFIATQVFIFGFTDQGLWADTYTAINRLPLHFVPALLFAVVVIAHASLTHEDTTPEAQSGNA